VIDFRYHVVSIVSVILALALGLFVGSTAFRTTVVGAASGSTATRSSAEAHLAGQLAAARAQLNQQQAFDAALEPYAVSGRLHGRTVVVVSVPGDDDTARAALLATLADAGATVTADVRLQPALLDPQQEAFLAALTARLVIPGRSLSAAAGVDRAVAQLAAVLVTRPGQRPVSSTAAANVISTYVDGRLVSIAGGQGPAPASASLAVVLVPAAPATPPSASGGSARQAVVLSLTAALAAGSTGAIVVGPSTAARPGGLLAAAASDPALGRVSTVAGSESVAGRVAAILALAGQAQGQVGHYGLGAGQQQPLPTPATIP
jgi:Copper transport outer membrane protein, MctB